MSRTTSGAVLLSIVLHCALLLLLSLIGLTYQPSTTASLPVVWVALHPSESRSDDNAEDAGAPRQDKTTPATVEPPRIDRPRPPVSNPPTEVASTSAAIPPAATEPTTAEGQQLSAADEEARSSPASPHPSPVGKFEPPEAELGTALDLGPTPPHPADPLKAPSVVTTSASDPLPGSPPTPLVLPTIPEPSLAAVATPRPPTRPSIPLPADEREMLQERVQRMAEELDDPSQRLSWDEDGVRYEARLTRLPLEDSTHIEHVSVELVRDENGERRSTRLILRRLAFSNFAQFVDEWDPAVQVHDDEIDGRFHSNSEIHVAYGPDVKPTFHGKVTTSSRAINTEHARGRVRREEMFLGGLETNVRRILLPREGSPLSGQGESSSETVHDFDEDTRITFYADGTYGWRPVEGDQPERRRALSDPTYLVGTNKARLHVKGVVKGRVLVYSPQKIIIEGDLRYASYPDVSATTGDYLGLVSDRFVEIAAPDVTGPGDLLITASIYAKRRFTVRNYRARDTASLRLFGSLTAGSLSATEPRYSTEIRFDPRLDDRRAPGFPMANRYELARWDAGWTVETSPDRQEVAQGARESEGIQGE